VKTLRETIDDYWKAIDWTLSYVAIARTTGAAIATVRAHQPKPKGWLSPRQKKFKQMAALDWNKLDADLARELRSPPSCMHYWRIKLNKPESSGTSDYMSRRKAAQRAVWNSWDWQKNDSTIAKELKLSRERVRQIRLTLGKPASAQKGVRDSQVDKTLLPHVDELKSMMPSEAANKFGFCFITITKFCRRHGIKMINGVQRKIELAVMHRCNWRLPSRTLSGIWGRPLQSFAAFRNSRKLRKPAYNLRRAPNWSDETRTLFDIDIQRERAAVRARNEELAAINGKGTP
jgi:hypothetical protein